MKEMVDQVDNLKKKKKKNKNKQKEDGEKVKRVTGNYFTENVYKKGWVENLFYSLHYS